VWTGTWAAAPLAAPASATIGPKGTTYRDIVHLSIGGRAIRLRISNEFGPTPLKIGSVHIALSAGGDRTEPQTDRAVLFGGADAVTIPTGAAVVSDAITMPVHPFANLAVSIYVPAQSGAALTYHAAAVSSNYVAAGDQTSAAEMDDATKTASWYLLKSVDVDDGAEAAAIVVLGASISEGYRSTPDRNARWPDVLATRLQASPASAHIGMLNEGIAGSRLLHDVAGQSALARMDRDMLAQSGAKYLIIAIGTNDIGWTFFPVRPNEEVTAEEMIWGFRQVVARAHARGFKVIGSTLSPFGGADYYSAAGEQMRQAVNAFLRTSAEFDGVVDFDSATRDPEHPERLLPQYDSGDHLHPNDAGYKAMGEAVDLKLFTK
jgi:lysophospholipase L1-like esterase